MTDILVIDQDPSNSDYNFDAASGYVYVVIAFVYAFFLALLVDKILDTDRIDKACNVPAWGYNQSQQELDQLQNMQNKCDKVRKDLNTSKFTYMMVLGVASILGGAYISKSDRRYAVGGWGMSLGGAMIVLYYTFVNWYMLDKWCQVIVLGGAFGALFYGSTML